MADERPKTLGQYNAWVEAGATKDEQLERLKEVPGQYRNDVIRHMRTVVALDRSK